MQERRKISIVAHALRAGGGIGVGKNLISALTHALPQARYQIFAPAELGYESIVPPETECEWVIYRSSRHPLRRLFYDIFDLPRAIRSFDPGIVLCLGNRGVDAGVGRQVLLIQDAHFFYPEKHYAGMALPSRLLLRCRKYLFARDLGQTAVLLCQTETARQRIHAIYGFRNRIEVIPNAVSRDVRVASRETSIEASQLATPAGNTGQLRLFCLANYYPHKNLEIFIDLFKRYRSALRNVVVYVTISPSQGKRAGKFLDCVQRERLQDHIVNLGPVSPTKLPELYRAVNALVLPSTLESFSGTYVEAMNFDCPILTSDLDFAREVCADAALYFDPWDTNSLFSVVQQAIDPAHRALLAQRGRHRIEQLEHSWARSAQNLATIIENLPFGEDKTGIGACKSQGGIPYHAQRKYR